MTSKLRVVSLLVLAGMAGVIVGHGVCASMTCRNAIGLWCKRGALIALVEGIGIYECDVDRAQTEWEDRNPDTTDENDSGQGAPTVDSMVANFRAERLARHEDMAEREIARQFELTQFQFQPKAWLTVLRANGLSSRSLRWAIAENLRVQSWIEKKIKPALTVRAEECAAYYDGHTSAFREPLRIRVSHIFFAAPPGSGPELVEEKRVAAQAIADRIGHGEKFVDLAIYSEDEASKKRGGDLNFLSESRVPSDFWTALKEMPLAGPPAVVRTSLGFHVVQVTDSRPARQIPLEEAQPSIVLALTNEKRLAAVAALTAELSSGCR